MMLSFKEFIQPPEPIQEAVPDTYEWRFKNRDSWLADYKGSEYMTFRNIGFDDMGAIWDLSLPDDSDPSITRQICRDFIKENTPSSLEVKIKDLAISLAEETDYKLTENNVLVRE